MQKRLGKRADRCSIPLAPSDVVKTFFAVFHDACNLHDLCYSSLNAKRSDCDDWFYHNMMHSCYLPTEEGTQCGAPATCEAAAATFHTVACQSSWRIIF